MDTIFMNSENSKKSDPHTNKINVNDKYVDLSNFTIY